MRSIETVFVPATDADSFAPALESAIRIAADTEACIEAFHVRDTYRGAPKVSDVIADGQLRDHFKKRIEAAARALRRQFEELCAKGPVRIVRDGGGKAGERPCALWREAAGTFLDLAPPAARCSDLVVMHNGGHADRSWEASLREAMLARSGAPCLFVPGPLRGPFARPLIAWNGSAEAARAVRAARPLIAASSTVTILTVGRLPEGAPPPERLAASLRRAGLSPTIRHVEDDPDRRGSDADQVEQQASEASADLLVMGAYGRPRWREAILGGVTRRMLHRPSRPVLMVQ